MKITMMATVVAGSLLLSGIALATDSAKPSSVIICKKNGTTTVVPIDAAKADQLITDPGTKEIQGNIGIFVMNGKAYMVEDHMMPNGTMLMHDLMIYDLPDGGG